MVASFQASFVSAPGGRPKPPMLRRPAPWKCTVNTHLPELHYTTPILYTIPRISTFQSHDTGYTSLRNQVWCL